MAILNEILQLNAEIDSKLRGTEPPKNTVERYFRIFRAKYERWKLKKIIEKYRIVTAEDVEELLVHCASAYPPDGEVGFVKRSVVRNFGTDIYPIATLLVTDKDVETFSISVLKPSVTVAYAITTNTGIKRANVEVRDTLRYNGVVASGEDILKQKSIESLKRALDSTSKIILRDMISRSERIEI